LRRHAADLVRLVSQPPSSSTFLSEQTSHQQPANITFLSQQISTSHQPPAKRTGCWNGARVWNLDWFGDSFGRAKPNLRPPLMHGSN
jgi:hypothetical protein